MTARVHRGRVGVLFTPPQSGAARPGSRVVSGVPAPRRPAYLADLFAPPGAEPAGAVGRRFRVASFNVHRWTGVRGGRTYDPEPAARVIAEMGADVVALQEALRPDGRPDPLRALAAGLGMHLAFVVTRQHRRGELGNAILSRWPLAAAEAIDLTFGRLERRAALAVRLRTRGGLLTVAATHLAIVDRTRTRQVHALLDHPHLIDGPAVLLGDMNAWRRTRGSRDLDAFDGDDRTRRHHNDRWPATWPSVRPVLALDRAYARGATLSGLRAHATEAARQASDHLPVVGTVTLDRDGPALGSSPGG